MQLKQDVSTVHSDGRSKQTLIEGVIVRPAITHVDERGTLTEIFNPAWGIVDFPLVYIYQSTIRPGKAKGWVEHHIQTERLFISQGHLKWALYDNRPESPTYKMVNVIYQSEINRCMIIIPNYVMHAVQNIGTTDATFINMPSHPYNHAEPDKYRLPLTNDIIPYRFDDTPGW
jgi:dTDP-4-dehydrorhamnose 3,5-epimerase